MSSAKWHPFCLCLNVLRQHDENKHAKFSDNHVLHSNFYIISSQIQGLRCADNFSQLKGHQDDCLIVSGLLKGANMTAYQTPNDNTAVTMTIFESL